MDKCPLEVLTKQSEQQCCISPVHLLLSHWICSFHCSFSQLHKYGLFSPGINILLAKFRFSQAQKKPKPSDASRAAGMLAQPRGAAVPGHVEPFQQC